MFRQGSSRQLAHWPWMLAVIVLGLSSCSIFPSRQHITWDLRTSHAKAGVPFQHDLSAGEIEHIDATVLVAGAPELKAQDVALGYSSIRGGNQLDQAFVQYQPETMDSGYQHTKSILQQWGVTTGKLESWYRELKDQRRQGKPDKEGPFFAIIGYKQLTPGGAAFFANVLDSFNDQKPFLLDLEFQWTNQF
jgi:hypothetical protein